MSGGGGVRLFTVNKNPTTGDLHKFGWSMMIGFGVLGALLWLAPWWKGGESASLSWSGAAPQIAAVCLWGLGVLLGALSRTTSGIARPVYVAWMSAVTPLGIVVSTIMLTVLFVLLLPVFALVVRLGDPLRRKLRRGGTYWEDYRPHEATLERTARPF